jgi:hypothetical protein
MVALSKVEGRELSYNNSSYDQAQRAYVISGNESGPRKISFQLGFPEKFEEEEKIPVDIVNPAFILKNWGETTISIAVNGKELLEEKEYRVGYEVSNDNIDLVVWLNYKSDKMISLEILPDSYN